MDPNNVYPVHDECGPTVQGVRLGVGVEHGAGAEGGGGRQGRNTPSLSHLYLSRCVRAAPPPTEASLDGDSGELQRQRVSDENLSRLPRHPTTL